MSGLMAGVCFMTVLDRLRARKRAFEQAKENSRFLGEPIRDLMHLWGIKLPLYKPHRKRHVPLK
jgi:hypothetical protein